MIGRSLGLLILLCIALFASAPVEAYVAGITYQTATSAASAVKSPTALEVGGEHDLLVRTLRGEKVERTPVWLMRQVKELRSTLSRPRMIRAFPSSVPSC